MDGSSYFALISFVVITIVYFAIPSIGKKAVTVTEVEGADFSTDYLLSNMPRLIIYFLMVIVFQFISNSIIIITKCGGSAGKNIGMAALITFIPWILIFGMLICILLMFPGFKSAFSDVIGYFVVSNGANKILNTILINDSIEGEIQKDESESDTTNKAELSAAASAIMKLVGDKGILINQMVPENFNGIWNMLKPLMHPQYRDDNNTEGKEFKEQLLGLVVLRDNIGEAMWYIYTAVLLTSIVSYNLTTRGCAKDVAQMKAMHEEYLQQEKDQEAQKELNDSTVYKVT